MSACKKTGSECPHIYKCDYLNKPCDIDERRATPAPASGEGVRQARIAALEEAASVIELYDDATMEADHMLDAGECAGIIRALKERNAAPPATTSAAAASEVPDDVWEALQRLIENGAVLGSASAEDALLVARYRDRHRFIAAHQPPAQDSAAAAGAIPEIPQDWRDAIQGVIDELGSAPQNFRLVARLTRLLRLAAAPSPSEPVAQAEQQPKGCTTCGTPMCDRSTVYDCGTEHKHWTPRAPVPEAGLSDERIHEIINAEVSELDLMRTGWYVWSKFARAILAAAKEPR